MSGYSIKDLQRTPRHVGCFVGISGTEWGMVPHAADGVGCGQHEAIISNRLNFSLNLKGSSQTLNTACSAGLVAMHTAKLHLKYKDFDPLEGVVAAGVQMAFSPLPFISCCSGGMLSYKGRSFTFDLSSWAVFAATNDFSDPASVAAGAAQSLRRCVAYSAWRIAVEINEAASE